MSNAIHSLRVLHNNPFILAPIFPAFYEGLGEKRNGILLSYLVLPLVLPEESRKFLKNAKSTSSLMTLAGKPNERERLFGLEERISEYKELTATTLQHLVDNNFLNITMYLSAKRTAVPDAILSPANTVKAAERFGKLCAPFDVQTVFRILGIKRL